MIVNINNKVIRIISSFDIVYSRLKQYKVKDQPCKNIIIINSDYIYISIDNKEIEINEKVSKTDIYPIINNCIAYCINDGTNLYIHSVVISKNGNGYLLIGDFGTGKTTFANVALDNGYSINSADQTWINNNHMVLGSSFNKVDNVITFLNDLDTNKDIKINSILIIKGLATYGKVTFKSEINREYNIKNLFKYCNWHYDMPLLTKYTKLLDSGENILKALNGINIPIYSVRGDALKIVEELNDREKSIK